MKVLALTKYSEIGASSRQRFLVFRDHLRGHGIELSVSPLLDTAYIEDRYAGARTDWSAIARAYLARLMRLRNAKSFDGVWLQYEFFPYLPGIMEAFASGRSTRLIVDYDDALFHQYDRHRNPIVRSGLGNKLKPLLRRADLAICGNAYLERYAAALCARTAVVPTVVDTAIYQKAQSPTDTALPVIGWIGSPTTWDYVKPIVPALSRLAGETVREIRIVGAPDQDRVPSGFEFLAWSEASEVALIQGMDIGIMPLPDEPWARGKCGYKLIQYMACGLPVVASPVGVNTEIVAHGVNGFLATTEADWVSALTTLSQSPDLRARMGAAGRAKVE
ncbi:MAG: glycosyltransferase family 4 protein, partial [Pseudomonadota bacterium]